MKFNLQAALLAVSIAWPAALATPASAQISPEFRNDKIVILEGEKGDGGYWTTSYKEFPPDDARKPIDPKRKELRERMKQRRILEEFVEFLSPLRMPHTLKVFASDCDADPWNSPHYNPGLHAINMCYSYMAAAENDIEDLVKNYSKEKWYTPASREQLVAGLFSGVLLHETGHALFDLMDVPMFGREEDAADQMAAFIALQFGKDTARTVIKGFAYAWAYDAFVWRADPRTERMDPKDPKFPKDAETQCRIDPICAFSDVHGTASQRMYNALCLAYGGDKANFQDFVDGGLLPPERAKLCEREYKRVLNAFGKTIYPFIDQAQMAKVKGRQWFQAKELK